MIITVLCCCLLPAVLLFSRSHGRPQATAGPAAETRGRETTVSERVRQLEIVLTQMDFDSRRPHCIPPSQKPVYKEEKPAIEVDPTRVLAASQACLFHCHASVYPSFLLPTVTNESIAIYLSCLSHRTWGLGIWLVGPTPSLCVSDACMINK